MVGFINYRFLHRQAHFASRRASLESGLDGSGVFPLEEGNVFQPRLSFRAAVADAADLNQLTVLYGIGGGANAGHRQTVTLK